jgi:hypothetical protein
VAETNAEGAGGEGDGFAEEAADEPSMVFQLERPE